MKNKILLYLMMLLLALFLTVIGFEIIQTVIIPPLYAFWIQIRYIIILSWKSQDQYFIWGLFILFSMLVVFYTIVQLYNPEEKPQKEIRDLHGPVRKWSERLKLMDEGVYYRWQFAQRIREITVRIIAYQTGKPESEVEEEIRSGLIELPPELISYLQAARQPDIRKYFSTYREKGSWNPIRSLDGNQLYTYIEELIEQTGG